MSLSSAIKGLNIVTGEGSRNLTPLTMFSPMWLDYKDSQFVHNMEYRRSNKSPLCGLTPTPITTQIKYSHYIFLSHVWEEEVSLDHSGSQPFINERFTVLIIPSKQQISITSRHIYSLILYQMLQGQTKSVVQT